jgi:hypothetical protein
VKPACMTDDEYAIWQAANLAVRGMDKAESPCRDCLPLFHADMTDGGMCDGIPGRRRRDETPEHWRLLSYYELQAVRRTYPHVGGPRELTVALTRARWREYQQRRRDAVTA